jgi:hypothetical protein
MLLRIVVPYALMFVLPECTALPTKVTGAG